MLYSPTLGADNPAPVQFETSNESSEYVKIETLVNAIATMGESGFMLLTSLSTKIQEGGVYVSELNLEALIPAEKELFDRNPEAYCKYASIVSTNAEKVIREVIEINEADLSETEKMLSRAPDKSNRAFRSGSSHYHKILDLKARLERQKQVATDLGMNLSAGDGLKTAA